MGLNSMHSANKQMMHYHDYQKKNERETHDLRALKRKEVEVRLQKEIDVQKEKDQVKMSIYRDTLNY